MYHGLCNSFISWFPLWCQHVVFLIKYLLPFLSIVMCDKNPLNRVPPALVCMIIFFAYASFSFRLCITLAGTGEFYWVQNVILWNRNRVISVDKVSLTFLSHPSVIGVVWLWIMLIVTPLLLLFLINSMDSYWQQDDSLDTIICWNLLLTSCITFISYSRAFGSKIEFRVIWLWINQIVTI